MKLTKETSLRTNRTSELLDFASFDRRKIQGSFTGGDVSSDGGLMALRAADKKLGLIEAFNAVIEDPRNKNLILHRQQDLLRQRIYGLALGYEDLNDHDTLRKDLLWQSAVERSDELASSPTLCRMEGRADRKRALAMSKVLVEVFIKSFKEAPRELILDFDATDDRVHGQQQGRAFHGYYGDWCFLPLYVFCGEQLLVSYLRASNADAALHSWAILKLLVGRLRRQWPEVKIIFRGDSGFCRWRMLRWCEKNQVDYVVDLAKNARLLGLIQEPMKQAAAAFAESKEKQRHFVRLEYAAQSWDGPRAVIAKIEHTEKGANPRFILTSLKGDGQKIYDEVFCARGEMENRIKEQQLGLFADRTSCHRWWANQFRLLLSSAAYVLMEYIRRRALSDTELARAQVTTIRLKMLKIGTVILQNTRRIRLLFSSAYPHQQLFATMIGRLSSA